MTDKEKIEKAMQIAIQYGGIDGDHHKAWVIDQMFRALAGDDYEKIIREACSETLEEGWNIEDCWSVGIAP